MPGSGLMLALTIASLVLHFVPVVTNLFGKGGASPAPSPPLTPSPNGGTSPPAGPSFPSRPVLDFIHTLMLTAEGSGNPVVAGEAQVLDSDLALLRQVLDNMGVKPLITLKP